MPFIFLIFSRKFIKKEHPKKFKEKIYFNKVKRPNGFLIWFHAASIGEFKSILPLIEYYLKQNPKNNFLVTTVTLSSYNEFERRFNSNKRVFHQFMPYDFDFLIDNFFKNWHPDIATFVDSEIWPNFILKIKKQNIPLILLNARLTKKSFQRWKFFGKSTKKIFECFSSCISSSRKTSEYLSNYFIDYEPGIHFNQFQMQSGVTGINAIRIYNPSKQQLDHDPEAYFVRRWVPELENIPLEYT